MLGGSTGLVRQAPGVFSGDLSGIAASAMPAWARLRYFPPHDLESIDDWQIKIDRFAERSLDEEITAVVGTPSWLLIYFERLAEIAGARRGGAVSRIADVYPDLEMLAHGGVAWAPYRDRFAALLEGSRAETREVYPASEGFFAVADGADGDGHAALLDNGIFYEFIPLDQLDDPQPDCRWIGDVEPGVNYALAVTTCAGLWRYLVGDTVTVVERDAAPRPRHRADQLHALRLRRARDRRRGRAGRGGGRTGDRRDGLRFRRRQPVPRGNRGARRAPLHRGAGRECGDAGDSAGLDARARGALRRGARRDALPPQRRLRRPPRRRLRHGRRARARIVPPGAFAAWMKSRGKLGGQNKVPRIINDQKLFDGLRRFADACGGSGGGPAQR